jgi:integrase
LKFDNFLRNLFLFCPERLFRDRQDPPLLAGAETGVHKKMLTAKKIESLLRTGRWERVLDGKQLPLQVRGIGRASWVLRYVSPISGKTRELGLGSIKEVSLAQARAAADDARALVRKKIDPIEAKRPTRMPAGPLSPTFGVAAEAFFEANQSRYRNAKVRGDWLRMLHRHCTKIWNMPVDAIGTDEVLSAIQPLWLPHNVTSRRIMHRVGQVMRFAHVKKWRPTLDNPARYGGQLEYVLPRNTNQNVRHHPCYPLADLPTLMQRLATQNGTAALAARFCIATCSRPGEAFKCQWDYIDLDKKIMTIPAGQYKTGKAHTIVLSSAAMAILSEAPRLDNNNFVFVAPNKKGRSISDVAVMALFKRLKISATLHGTSRANFSSFCHNRLDAPFELVELALGHSQGAVVKAYWREYPVEKIRVIMEQWGDYLTSAAQPLKVAAQ